MRARSVVILLVVLIGAGAAGVAQAGPPTSDTSDTSDIAQAPADAARRAETTALETALERVRRDPVLASNATAIDELVRLADGASPTSPSLSSRASRVRIEAWALAAEAYAHRLGRPADADALLRRIVVDPSADLVDAQLAARDLVRLRADAGDVAGAEEVLRVAGGRADPKLAPLVARLRRRRTLHHAAIAMVGGLVLLAARAIAAAARRAEPFASESRARIRGALAKSWALALGFAAYVGVVGALLASRYEGGTSTPFLALGLALVPLLLIARAWGAAASGGKRAARLGRAGLCAAGVLGAAFLVLERIDVAYLDGFGL